MIKADQIPDAVVEAAAIERWGINEPTKWELDTCRIIIAAAINAWPGFEYRADVAFPAFGYGPNGIILPLLNEESE